MLKANKHPANTKNVIMHSRSYQSSVQNCFSLSSGLIGQQGAAFMMVRRTTFSRLSVFKIWRCRYFVVCFDRLTWSESVFSDTRGPAMKDKVSRLPFHKWCWMFVLTTMFVLSDVGTQGVVYSDIRIKPPADATSSSSDRCTETAHTDDVTYSEVLVLYQKSKSW